MDVIEELIAEWRAYVARSRTIEDTDVDELETHLRDQMADLQDGGLSAEEAFLVAVKRMGEVDGLAREFALEHSDRLWKQLVMPRPGDERDHSTGLVEALGLAIGAAVVIQIALRAGGWPDDEPLWVLRNAGLLILPFLAGYFIQRRSLPLPKALIAAAPFVLAAVAVNLYPYDPDSSTEALVALHLPVALWFVVGYAYVAGNWRSHERRMDFVRFSGEWFIYYALIALGGGVLMGLTMSVLEPVRAGLGEDVFMWVVPSGAAGAVVIAAWLVEAKQSVIENMAPVLTMVFTPLFAFMLTASAVVYAASGLGGDFDREQLAVFDVLLLVVLGLVLYGLSAREGTERAGLMDYVQLLAVAAALVLDAMVLGSMLGRIGDLGFTPNRVAALGLNLVLLGNLGVAAWLALRLLRGRATFHRLARWQTTYLPVFLVWAAAVVLVLPPMFSFG